MTATLNDKSVLSGEIREPRVGAWTAEVDVDTDTPITGAVTLEIDSVVWKGYVVRGDVEAGRYHAVIVGGAGGLARPLPPKHYVSAPMRIMLGEILSAAGETQSTSSDASVGTRFMDRWSRVKGSAGHALRQVADDLGVSWRVLRDGSVWFGAETWPDAGDITYDEIQRLPGRGKVVLAPEAPLFMPGTTWNGARVSEVRTFLSPGLRQELTLEDSTVGAYDRTLQMFSRIVDSLVGRRVDYSNVYPARTVGDSAGDGTVELLPDDERIKGSGIARVPVRPGLPGTTLKLKAGSRVTLYFEGNDVKKPAASLWESGTGVLEIAVEAETKITLTAPTVVVDGDLEVTGEVTANVGPSQVTLTKHIHPTPTGPSSPATKGM